nr:unnamed protein product [Callosobruchus chinensis]
MWQLKPVHDLASVRSP